MFKCRPDADDLTGWNWQVADCVAMCGLFDSLPHFWQRKLFFLNCSGPHGGNLKSAQDSSISLAPCAHPKHHMKRQLTGPIRDMAPVAA